MIIQFSISKSVPNPILFHVARLSSILAICDSAKLVGIFTSIVGVFVNIGKTLTQFWVSQNRGEDSYQSNELM